MRARLQDWLHLDMFQSSDHRRCSLGKSRQDVLLELQSSSQSVGGTVVSADAPEKAPVKIIVVVSITKNIDDVNKKILFIRL